MRQPTPDTKECQPYHIYAKQGQPPVTRSIVARIRAAVAKTLGYGQRKRERKGNKGIENVFK